MKHHLITPCIFVAAIALYAIGLTVGATALFIVGGALELWVWGRVMRKPKPSAGRT